MRIGIDFDNTLVCYDVLFHRLALELNSIPVDLSVNKTAVRDYLRSQGRESLWTEIQGIVYGSRIQEASPFPGAIDFIRQAHGRGDELMVISHKTRYPFLGEQVDLHESAKGWLKKQGVDQMLKSTDSDSHFFFELTKEAKMERISQQQCDCFIDDLPEILTDALFPNGVRKICFDPGMQVKQRADFEVVQSWDELKGLLV